MKSLHRNVWILGCVSLLTDFGTKMIQSILPLFLVSVLGANLITVGLIEGIAEATASVVKIFSGVLSDYWGRRKELAIAGYGLSALVIPFFVLANHPIWILIARFGDRFGKGLRVAPRNALIADVTPAGQRGAAFGLRQSLDTIGAFAGPLVAIILMYSTGQNYRLIFAIAFIPGFLSILLLIVGIQEPRQAISQKQSPWQWNNFKQLKKEYWTLLLVALVFNLANFSDAFLILRANQVGISQSLIPLSLVIMNLTYSLSSYPFGLLSDRMGRTKILSIGLLLFALVYLGFAFANNPLQIWVLFGVYGLHLGLSQGVLLALVTDYTPSALRGTAFGLMSLVIGLALLPASGLAGLLWQFVNPQAPFLVGSLLAIASMVILLLIPNNTREDNVKR
ncbi:MFS transporter [Gloeocapsa sp. PCC 73106]|uniref:MFS transporter n=1 Tax=Gloeocapsa sp. PCC 73106 TaxID=102232 RepID=UPI0002AC0393|nr:MFS transporter [Gloeocapsa sp. PCC 73106]ELR97619.1 arabinose efflux permease family protein [Gloeocapsa sp. PCC 73106]